MDENEKFQIIKKLVDIVSKGGNYLLNIGPNPDGELDDTAYSRLKEIGEWIRVNGEAIYGTRMYSSYKDGESVRFTQSKDGRTKYIFMLDFPEYNLQISKFCRILNLIRDLILEKSP